MNIFNIQHFSTGDGFGIRSTVFLGGCNLRCPWCHNPEGLFGAANERTLDDIVDNVMADLCFYEKSGGGVTLSGGDPMYSFDDCLLLAKTFSEKGLHVIVDTAMSVPDVDLETLSNYVDCYFVDVKTADPEKFATVCGGDLSVVREHLEWLAANGKNVVLRIPMIPGFNMDEASVTALADWIAVLPFPITLLPFHRLGSSKYDMLGMTYAYADTEPPTPAQMEAIQAVFTARGITQADV